MPLPRYTKKPFVRQMGRKVPLIWKWMEEERKKVGPPSSAFQSAGQSFHEMEEEGPVFFSVCKESYNEHVYLPWQNRE